ncbi:MAG: AAA family ATPase [Nitrospira sp.]|nr:AAA family ATPase [Nitrospira sp.]
MMDSLETGLELERNFIAALFMNASSGIMSTSKELPDFSKYYFADMDYGEIYYTIRKRAEAGLPCGLADIAEDLQNKVRATAISEAADYFPGLKDPAFYARQIQEAYFKRNILRKLQGILDDVERPLENITEAINKLVDEIPKPTQNNLNNSILTLPELLIINIPVRQKIIVWMPEGSLVMVYGPRGIGKTFFVLELIKSLACGSPFLKWLVSRPAGVLFVDGEMSLQDIRKRFTELLNEKTKEPVYFLSHEYFYNKTEKDLNLASPDFQYSLQQFIESHPDVTVIVFDNLSCLLPGIREDKRDDWTTQVLPFLLWLRRRGVSVVMIHHSGKSLDQRGTSSREDALDTIIRLDRIPNAGNEGAEFIIRFTKSRGAYGDHVSDIEAKLTISDGVSTWAWKPLKESTEDRLLALIAEGIDNVTDAAEELEISKGLVSRIKKKLQNEGKLLPGKELKIFTQSKGQ